MLTDAELTQFIDLGYVVMELGDVPESTHDTLFAEAREAYAAAAKLSDTRFALDMIADNIPARIPKIREILESTRVNEALNSVLGPKFFRHPLRHLSLAALSAAQIGLGFSYSTAERG
jgi:hypothetical protein